MALTEERHYSRRNMPAKSKPAVVKYNTKATRYTAERDGCQLPPRMARASFLVLFCVRILKIIDEDNIADAKAAKSQVLEQRPIYKKQKSQKYLQIYAAFFIICLHWCSWGNGSIRRSWHMRVCRYQRLQKYNLSALLFHNDGIFLKCNIKVFVMCLLKLNWVSNIRKVAYLWKSMVLNKT